jgi:hypothetical protein
MNEMKAHQSADPDLVNIPSAHWALMIGDAIHNFRSALDHLVFSWCW